MKLLYLILFLILSLNCFAQNIAYVHAQNGLIVRNNPNKSATRIGKLDYGSEVYILKETNIKINIVDDNKNINGQWLEIKNFFNEGKAYVFSGFIAYYPARRLKEINFKDISFLLYLDVYDDSDREEFVSDNKVILDVELNNTPEGKKVSITKAKYSKVEIFQRYENSITIMNEGPHCDLVDWKHFYSQWEPITYNYSDKSFIIKEYTESDGSMFIPITISDLIKTVKKTCGTEWSNLLKISQSPTAYPVAVATSAIELKIILTDAKGFKVEKLIVFRIPMGC